MAHNINIENGEASMFYFGKTPWHELGTRLEGPATSAEAIKVAKLDWNIRKIPLFAIDPVSRTVLNVDKKFAIVPEHKLGKPDCPVFCIAGEEYTPVQNHEAFSFFDSIVGGKKAIYHTAGALGGGERVWILAKLPSNIVLTDDDNVGKFLLLSNSHDGSSSISIKFTPIRVVCQNTLIAALEDGRTIQVPHLRDVRERLEKAKDLLGIIGDAYGNIEETFKKMLKYQLNKEKLDGYLDAVFPDSSRQEGPDREKENRLIKERREISRRLFETGRGNNIKKVSGSLWAAYNGVTEMVDYTRKVYGDRRLHSIWFGEGARIKMKAYRTAEEMIAAKK